MTGHLTPRQIEAREMLRGSARYPMLFGGSRSGKTFLFVRAICARALKAPMSRHALFRLHRDHIKGSIFLDTFPKVMQMCWPEQDYSPNKSDLLVAYPNGSEIWFGGLDDKDRVDKVLGNEYATIFLNECSQISYSARATALTRLAQRVQYRLAGETRSLLPKCYNDCNPPSKAHWTYQLYVERRDPETKQPLRNAADYPSLQMNPGDNAENLPPEYLRTLEDLPARMRTRFLRGEFADANPNALWNEEILDKCRHLGELPDLQRIVVGVDPSGAGDVDNAENDAIGVVVGALGTDGRCYILEDLTLKAGPATWGRVVGTAFDRHKADLVVGEKNFGGAMVQFVIRTARPNTPYKDVTASRGKVVRAEPVSALCEQGKIRFVGSFPALEDELCGFTTGGYVGDHSPNRADAFVWVVSELFPGLVQPEREKPKPKAPQRAHVTGGWMAA